MQIKQLSILALCACLLSCESVETSGEASSASVASKLSVPKERREYGYMTPSGLVLNQSKENTIDY